MTTEDQEKPELELVEGGEQTTPSRKRETAPNRAEILKSFGQWLEGQRRTMRSQATGEYLTQVDVANMAGISRVNYSSIENGSVGVSYEMAKKLARVLGLGETEAVIRAGYNPGFSPDFPLAWLAMERLPKEAQEIVLKQIKSMEEVYGKKQK